MFENFEKAKEDWEFHTIIINSNNEDDNLNLESNSQWFELIENQKLKSLSTVKEYWDLKRRQAIILKEKDKEKQITQNLNSKNVPHQIDLCLRKLISEILSSTLFIYLFSLFSLTFFQ